jgi:sugar phosphate isomerase/epimerase
MAASKPKNPKCYATCSIGLNSSASLTEKLDAISKAGFEAIELAYPDIVSTAKSMYQCDIAEDDYQSICQAAKVVRSMCEERNLNILILQPFSNFEGWPKGSEKRKKVFEKARGWIRVMEAAGTDMLQVGTWSFHLHV